MSLSILFRFYRLGGGRRTFDNQPIEIHFQSFSYSFLSGIFNISKYYERSQLSFILELILDTGRVPTIDGITLDLMFVAN